MKLGVLSDIHGNYEAFKTCIDYLKKREVDAFVLLGDYVGELPCPEKSLELLKNLQKENNCYIIRGNKEDYILQGIGGEHPEWDDYPSVVGMLRYGFEHCTQEDKEYFDSLPITDVINIEGYPAVRICHGTVEKTNAKMEKESEEAVLSIAEDYILCGHTHRQKTIEIGKKHIFNPGSVGLVVDEGKDANCMILHGTNTGWEPEYLEVPYDVEAEIESMKKEGLFTIAPCWSVATEAALRGKKVYHSRVLSYAMNLCEKEQGSCEWPKVPEEYMRMALEEMIYKKES